MLALFAPLSFSLLVPGAAPADLRISLGSRCVRRMDHHCPWINNCCGERNYNYFLSFLFYVWLASAYGVLILYPSYKYDRQQRLANNVKPFHRMHLRWPWLMDFSTILRVLFPLAAALCIALGLFLGFHAHLVYSGQTNIEYFQNADRRDENNGQFTNPFDAGLHKNLEAVFGRPWWLTLVLPACGRHRATQAAVLSLVGSSHHDQVTVMAKIV